MPQLFVTELNNLHESFLEHGDHEDIVEHLLEIKRAHFKELALAQRGYLQRMLKNNNIDLDPSAMAFAAMQEHARACERKEVARLLRDTFQYKSVMEPETFLDERLSHMVMFPRFSWTDRDYYQRVLYLLGDDDEPTWRLV